jgi:hypothetical protein
MIGFLKFVVILSLSITALFASPNIGQEILEKKLKSGCSISIADLAAKHTQKEWKELKDSNRLRAELKRLEPNLTKISDKELPDIFDFLYEYGSDSGLFPSCGS